MGRNGNGVEVRPNSIRLRVTLANGEIVKETLMVNGKPLPPTPPNIKFATRIAGEIRRKIEIGTFTFAEFFPDSPRAQTSKEEPQTFAKLADLWLESKGRLADATRDQYRTAVRFWKKLLGETRLTKDIDHKLLAVKIGGYPWPSAKTHNNYLIALRGIFGLEYRGAASINDPLNGIENMPVVQKLPDPMSMDERDTILADIEERYDERVHAYFIWMFYTGMRPEEAIALRWSDIDWTREVVRIQRVRTYKGSEREGSKTHTERDVDLVPEAIEALEIMKSHTFMLKGKSEDQSADIFQNPVTGRAWHDERSQRDNYWRPALKRLGIRWRKPYNTRHTYATVALMAGVPPAYIAALLGHSVKMLLEKYARWMPANDPGTARQMLAQAMSRNGRSSRNSSPEFPQKPRTRLNRLINRGNSGRRDWTRTNDPHHVKGSQPIAPLLTN